MSTQYDDPCVRRNETPPPCGEPVRCTIPLRPVLKHRPPEHHDDVDSRLLLLGGFGARAVYSQATQNFENEHLLSCEFWQGFIDTLRTADVERDQLCESLKNHMRRYCLRGPDAQVPRNVTLGRAVTKENLADYFTDKWYFGTHEAALKNIDDMERATLETVHRQWGTFELGRYVFWATLSPDGNGPFDGWADCAATIENSLGLNRRNKPLILLEYRLEGGGVPKMPTIAEAYAGDWNYYFRPATPSQVKAGFGLTYVRDETRQNELGRPEVVHGPVTGRLLTAPPREIS